MTHRVLKTASGTIINHSHYADTWSQAYKQQRQNQAFTDYPGIQATYYTHLDLSVEELLPCQSYNCWGFTFNPRQCWITSGNDVQNILNDNCISVQDGSIQVGDVICYRLDGGITHTGRVHSVDGSGHAVLIRSKWGNWGEYLHSPLNVPDIYGTELSYWRLTAHLMGLPLLNVKDNNTDDGCQCSSYPFWVSPDIWVDSNLDGVADDNPIANQTNHIYARVRNIRDEPISNVEVRFYWADPAGGIPPADWNLIGTDTIANLAANSDSVAGPVSWVPQPVPSHQCLLVIVHGGDGILETSGPDPIVYSFDVYWDRRIGMKNVTVIEVKAGKSTFIPFKIKNLFREPKKIDISIKAVYKDLHEYKAILKEPWYNTLRRIVYLPLFRPVWHRGILANGLKVDVQIPANLRFKELETQQRHIQHLKAIRLEGNESKKVGFRIKVPSRAKPGTRYTYDVTQRIDGQITGGCTYIIKVI